MNSPSDLIILTAEQKAEIRKQAHLDIEEMETTFGPIEQLMMEDQFPHLKLHFKNADIVPGLKDDSNKVRMELIIMGMSRALLEVGKVATGGAKKYKDNSWQNVPNGIMRYTGALSRHLLAEGKGEVICDDFGLSHAAHVAWNALARLDLILREQESNDKSI